MLTRWLDLWRQEPFRIATSLPPDAARARIRDALAELPRALRNPWLRVHQRWRGTDLTFRASTPRGSWAAVVRARFVPTATGCEVVGSYGWPLWIRLFTGASLGGVLLIWGGMLQAVVSGAPRDGPVVVFVVGPLLMVAFVVVLVGKSGALGRREAVLALDHIAARLAETGSEAGS